LFIAAALTVAVGSLLADDAEGRFLAMWIGALVAVFGVRSVIVSSVDRVDTRNVGIVTQFGRPVGARGAGIAWHAPWQNIYEMSEAIQLQAFDGESYEKPGSAVQVRLKNNSAAYVSLNLNWRLREGSAPKLFQDYGGSNADVFNVIRENLVDRQAQVALANEFAGFDPTTQAQGADLSKMASNVKDDLQTAVGSDIEIIDVRIPRIFYDSATVVE
jgi:regulator of protease activity HflC (stomatin/prohibitin superfamily)